MNCNGKKYTNKEHPKTNNFAVGDNRPRQVSEIILPNGFNRISYPSNSFSEWLRQISLKKDNGVYLFNGDLKANQDAQFAMLDKTVGKQDLLQCAGAVMRLRAEYLFTEKNMMKFNSQILI